jgi:hypothetical protein
MAELSLGESKWRMLRRALKKQRFQFQDARNGARNDQEHFAWLVEKGFFQDLGGGEYEVTEKGKGAADLGMYESDEVAATKLPRPDESR